MKTIDSRQTVQCNSESSQPINLLGCNERTSRDGNVLDYRERIFDTGTGRESSFVKDSRDCRVIQRTEMLNFGQKGFASELVADLVKHLEHKLHTDIRSG